jgi:hypothetical protein
MDVAALGALGGALAATLSIRNLKGTSTPYDVPVALAFLKVPLGAMTALLALIAIQGDFVPGLSVLDSQGQILAYALVFGFAQQAFSRLLDQRAQTLLEGLPGGTGTEPDPVGASRPEPPVAREPAGTSAGVPPAEQPPAAPTPVADDGATPPGDEAAPTAADQATGPGAPPADSGDRPVDEPEGATQEDQLALLRESGNARDEVTEDEEARMLEAEFGPPDASGIYRSRQDAVVP